MPSTRVPKDAASEIFFVTFTVHRWYYLFDRYNRWDIIAASLRYCQEHKGLSIYHYVFMLNHVHLIAQCDDMSGFIRDFKTYTSKAIKRNIEETEPQILKLFEKDGEYHFWQKTNMPEIVRSEDFYRTKANYIEQNPVRKQYVNRAEDWVYSSANRESGILKLDNVYNGVGA